MSKEAKDYLKFNLIFIEFVKILHNCSCLGAKWYTSTDASGSSVVQIKLML